MGNTQLVPARIRDYTDIVHLVVLANLENLNAEMIKSGISQGERLIKLNNTAKKQLELLKDNASVKRLEKIDKNLKLKKKNTIRLFSNLVHNLDKIGKTM